jgi:hypothetical protein
MFPFKTKTFSKTLAISELDFENALLKYARQHRFISVQNHRRHQATLSGAKMDWAISEVRTRNSFRPVLVFKWQGIGDKTLLTGFYRLSKGVLTVSFAFFVFGIVVTIKEQSIYPILLFGLLWPFFFQILGFLFFRKEFDWMQENFEDIMYEVLHTKKVGNRPAGE